MRFTKDDHHIGMRAASLAGDPDRTACLDQQRGFGTAPTSRMVAASSSMIGGRPRVLGVMVTLPIAATGPPVSGVGSSAPAPSASLGGTGVYPTAAPKASTDSVRVEVQGLADTEEGEYPGAVLAV